MFLPTKRLSATSSKHVRAWQANVALPTNLADENVIDPRPIDPKEVVNSIVWNAIHALLFSHET